MYDSNCCLRWLAGDPGMNWFCVSESCIIEQTDPALSSSIGGGLSTIKYEAS